MKLTLVYLAAGISSRFGGKLKQFAKIGINDEPLIELSLRQLPIKYLSKIIFVVGEKTELPLKNFLGNSFKGIPVFYAMQHFNPSKRKKTVGHNRCFMLC